MKYLVKTAHGISNEFYQAGAMRLSPACMELDKEVVHLLQVASRHESKIEKSKNQRLWVWL
jgi:hypothetical protein